MGQTVLARDNRNAVLQVTSYNTTSSINLDGSGGVVSSTPFEYNSIVRIKAVSGQVWLQVDSPAVSLTGMYFIEGDEMHMAIDAGSYISVVGGFVNIVSTGN